LIERSSFRLFHETLLKRCRWYNIYCFEMKLTLEMNKISSRLGDRPVNRNRYPILILALALALAVSIRSVEAAGLQPSGQVNATATSLGAAAAYRGMLTDSGTYSGDGAYAWSNIAGQPDASAPMSSGDLHTQGISEKSATAPTATITVNSTQDSDNPGDGLCTLREAITNANDDADSSGGDCAAGSGTDAIQFAIGAVGSQQTITLTSNLPNITDPVVLDGWSQGGADYTGPPLVEINGENLNSSGDRGFRILSGGSTVRGFVINRFDAGSSAAIWLHDADGNWIVGNYIGVSADGTTALPNYYGIWIANYLNSRPSHNNVIGTNGDGVNDAFEGNVIAASTQEEIRAETDGNTVAGNFIGTDADGSVALSSSSAGIILYGDDDIVGTDGDGVSDDLEGNVISGNGGGIYINNSSGHTIAGNVIGLDASGSTALGNSGDGISCNASANASEQIIIGSNNDGISDDLEGNVIAGNTYGYSTFYNNCRHVTISRNKIGTNSAGTADFGNSQDGIIVSEGDWYTITHNLISGNNDDGINLGSGANNVTIANNIIGADASGTVDLGNTVYGIRNDFSSNQTIADNQISGNNGGGILSNGGANVTIEGNQIGVQADGVSDLGNGFHGVYIFGGTISHTIASNIIAYNGRHGVVVDGPQATGHTINANAIFDNVELGIDLDLDGVTPTDPDDVDTGPNGLQNYPAVLSATNTADTITIGGTLDSTPNSTFTLEFFSNAACDSSGNGEGETYLGSDSVTTNADGDGAYSITLPVLVPEGRYLAATATDAAGNTSEFSVCFGPTGPVQENPITGLTASNDGPQLDHNPVRLSAAVTTGGNATYEWNPGDDSGILGGQTVTHTYETQGTYTAVVTATNSVSQQTATTVVTITRSAFVVGHVWDDWDGDAQPGPGETRFDGETVRVEQNGRVYTSTANITGAYDVRGLDVGSYFIYGPTISGYRPFGALIRVRQVTIPGNGTTQDFKYRETFDGVQGRVWLDDNFNDRYDAFETLLTNHPVTLTAVTTGTDFTTTSDSNGHYRFDLGVNDGDRHTLTGERPLLYEETSRTFSGANQAAYVVNLAFKPGAVGGCVTNPGGSATVDNLTVTLSDSDGQTLATTNTGSDSCYLFSRAEAQGAIRAALTPTAGEFILGAESQLAVYLGTPLRVDWQVATPGSVMVEVKLNDNYVEGVPVHLEQSNGVILMTETLGINVELIGVAHFDTVVPGPITVTVPGGIGEMAIRPRQWTYDLPGGSSAAGPTFDIYTYGIQVECRTPPVPGQEPEGRSFPCRVLISQSNVVDPVVDETVAADEMVFYRPTTCATYSVLILPELPGGSLGRLHYDSWPLCEWSTRIIRYPYYLPDQVGPVTGMVWADMNANGTQETAVVAGGEGAAIGFTVELLGSDGNLVDSTTTDGNGRYDLFPPGYGSYSVRLALPAGDTIVATTPDVVNVFRDLADLTPDVVNFGLVVLSEGVEGRVRFTDIWGSYASGVTVELLDPADTATPLDTTTTGPSGRFDFGPLLAGEYLLRVLPPNGGVPVERPVTIAQSGAPFQEISLPPEGSKPTIFVYVDSNHNGLPDSGEGMPDLSVAFDIGVCGNVIDINVTNSDGFTQSDLVLPSGGCARVTSTLPDDLIRAQPEGVELAPYDGGIVPLELIRTGWWLVRPYWDVDGDGSYDTGEPTVLDDVVIVPDDPAVSVTRLINGFEVSGPVGYAEITIQPPAGGVVPLSQPRSIYLYQGGGGGSSIYPVQFLGGVSGALAGPTSSAVSGRTIQLVAADGTVIATTTAGVPATSQPGGRSYTPPPATTGGPTSAPFSFNNVAPGTYTVRLVDVPEGTVYHGDVVVVHDPANPSNVSLLLTGNTVLPGVIYWDNNYNGDRDSGEPGTQFYDVVLLNDAGMPEQALTPAADGTFVFTGLQSDVQYALTVPDLYDTGGGITGNWITESPGWFEMGSLATAHIGLGNYAIDNPNSLAVGQVYVQNGTSRDPVAGATVGYYQLQGTSGLCNAANPTILGQTTTGGDGRYRLPLTYIPGSSVQYCLVVLEAPGLVQNDLTVIADAAFCYYTNLTPAGVYRCDQTLNLLMDIKMRPVTTGLQAVRNDNAIAWSAFRDDNLNGFWDEGEFPLPGVMLQDNGITATSQIDGSGLLAGLSGGEQTLAILSPAGYVPVGPDARTLWLTGADVTLPPLGFVVDGMVSGIVFADKDGDGWLGSTGEEFGLGGVTVTLSGPVVTTTVTNPDGRFTLAGLPDGTYAASAGLPAGYVTQADSIAVSDGYAAVRLPAQTNAHITGSLYDDWDGDGLRSVDEPLVTSVPVTVTVSGVGSTLPLGGSILFWDVAPGSYMVDPLWDAAAGGSATLSANSGGGVTLPAVSPGVVRGTVWLDADGDDIRPPWEVPVAGVVVTLDGAMTATTDENGHFAFYGVPDGSHAVAASLPTGLASTTPVVSTGDGRGAAVGIGATSNTAPIADAGPDQTVAYGALVTLDGSGSSDPDGNLPLTYGWQQTGGTLMLITLADPNVVSPTFTAPDVAGVFTFTLVVTDSLGLADPTPDEVAITVQAPADQYSIYLPLTMKGVSTNR
jgi:CSLREA domain-containing protein